MSLLVQVETVAQVAQTGTLQEHQTQRFTAMPHKAETIQFSVQL
jgi:hypothetical protein